MLYVLSACADDESVARSAPAAPLEMTEHAAIRIDRHSVVDTRGATQRLERKLPSAVALRTITTAAAASPVATLSKMLIAVRRLIREWAVMTVLRSMVWTVSARARYNELRAERSDRDRRAHAALAAIGLEGTDAGVCESFAPG